LGHHAHLEKPALSKDFVQTFVGIMKTVTIQIFTAMAKQLPIPAILNLAAMILIVLVLLYVVLGLEMSALCQMAYAHQIMVVIGKTARFVTFRQENVMTLAIPIQIVQEEKYVM